MPDADESEDIKEDEDVSGGIPLYRRLLQFGTRLAVAKTLLARSS